MSRSLFSSFLWAVAWLVFAYWIVKVTQNGPRPRT